MLWPLVLLLLLRRLRSLLLLEALERGSSAESILLSALVLVSWAVAAKRSIVGVSSRESVPASVRGRSLRLLLLLLGLVPRSLRLVLLSELRKNRLLLAPLRLLELLRLASLSVLLSKIGEGRLLLVPLLERGSRCDFGSDNDC